MKMVIAIGSVVLNCAVCFAAENVAKGRPYTFSHAPNYLYCTDPGDATDLTDGQAMRVSETASFPAFWMADRKSRAADGTVHSIGTAVGWTGGATHKSIEIDLGQICTINGLTFNSCAGIEATNISFASPETYHQPHQQPGAGKSATYVAFPASIMVFLSDDGQTYSYAGDLIDPKARYKEAYAGGKFAIETFKLEGLADQARFVRLQMVQTGTYLFVDEIEVFGSKPAGLAPRNRKLTSAAVVQFAQDRAPQAAKIDLPKVSVPAKGTRGKNLALGRPYTFPTGHTPNYWYCIDPGDATDLTDGISRGSASGDQGTVGWASLGGNKHESVEIDLGQICRINGVTFSSSKIFPVSVMIFLSDDGKTYRYAGDVVNEAPPPSAAHTFRLEGLAEQGRFVRVQMVNGEHYMYVDEIEVFGSKPAGLTPKRGEIASGDVVEFVKNGAPTLRQRNSSLAFLGRAQSHLAREPEKYKAAVTRAQKALEGIRAQIMARTKPEKVEYRNGAPFTKLDTAVCRVIGEYLVATGRKGLRFRPAALWAPLSPFDWDASATTSEPPLMLQKEWGELAFNLSNATSNPMELSVTLGDLKLGTVSVPTSAISLCEVKFVESSGFLMHADALMPLKGKLDIPAGMTKQLWLTIDTRDLKPGEYRGEIQVSGDGISATKPFAFTIAPIAMPVQQTLYFKNWSYMHYQLAKTHPKQVAKDLHEHYTNVQQVISSYLPNFQADAEGNFTGPMDFSKLDRYMELLPDTKLWILWPCFDYDHRSMYPKKDEPKRAKLLEQWLRAVIDHMKAKGYDYDRYAFEWIDEAGRQEMVDIAKPSCEILRKIDPKVQVCMNISSDLTEADMPQFEGLIDIWIPSSNKRSWNFWKGKRVWTYDSSSNKGRSPTGHYRYTLWAAFNRGDAGTGFWTYTDDFDEWDDYAGTPSWSVVYDGPDGVVSSKRWEAYRAGIEDYELCTMLRKAIAAGKGNPADLEAAQKALDEWVKRVLNSPDDPMVAEQAHQELLRHLVKVSRS